MSTHRGAVIKVEATDYSFASTYSAIGGLRDVAVSGWESIKVAFAGGSMTLTFIAEAGEYRVGDQVVVNVTKIPAREEEK